MPVSSRYDGHNIVAGNIPEKREVSILYHIPPVQANNEEFD